MNLEMISFEAEDEIFKNNFRKLQTIANTILSIEESNSQNNSSLKISLYKDLFSCINKMWCIEYFEFMYISNKVCSFIYDCIC